jgi:hypothetical protein
MSLVVAINLDENSASLVTAETTYGGKITIVDQSTVPLVAPAVSLEQSENGAAPTNENGSESIPKISHIPEDADCTLAVFPADNVLFETLNLPFNDSRTLSQIVPIQLQDTIPFDIANFVVDSLPLGKTSSDSYQILASLTPVSDIAKRISDLKGLGANPKVLTTKASAISALAEHVGEKVSGESFALILLSTNHCSMAIFSNGTIHSLREIPGQFTSEDGPRTEKLTRELRSTIASVERQIGNRLSSILASGNNSLIQHLAISLGRPLRAIDLGELYEVTPELDLNEEDINWAIGLFLSESNRKTQEQLVNFRRGPFAYKPLWGNFVAALKDELTWIILAVFFIVAWFSTEIYSSHAKLAEVENAIEAEFMNALPGEPVPRRQENSFLESRVEEMEEQLRDLGSLSSLSPLNSLKELSVAIQSNVDIEIEAINIGHTALSFRGSVKDIPSVGRLDSVLEARKERFCSVEVNSRGKAPGSNRVKFQAEVTFCK